MNIIHFTGMRSNKFGSLERYFVEISRQLLEYEYKLILVYEEYPTSSTYIKELKSNNVKIEILKTRGSSILKTFHKVLLLLNKYKPTIVHTYFSPATYYALIASFVLRYPVRIHSFGSMITNENDIVVIDKNELKYKTRFILKLIYHFSTDILSVSNGIKKQFEDLFNKKDKIKTLYVGVVSNGSDVYDITNLKLKNNVTSNDIIISCVAFHGHVKGIDILLKAINVLKQKNMDVPFKVLQIGTSPVGKSKYTNYLKQLAVDLGVQDCITWMGLRNDVNEILAISDIYCQPSRSEGISLALMEASMIGLPLVGSNVGGIPEIIINNETGFLIDVEDYNEMAAALENLIKNKALRDSFAVKSRERAIEKFNLSKQVQNLIHMYEDRING